MSRRSKTSDTLRNLWFRHDVQLQGEEIRTMRGTTFKPGETVKASINMESHRALNQHGEEVLAAGTINWDVDGPLPEPGDVLTLPDDFGAKPQRKVVSARRAYSGTGLTPDHVEVTIV